jgi:hypothetical protein
MPVCKVLPSCNACLQLNDVEETDNGPAGESREVIKCPSNKRLLDEEAVHVPKVKRGAYSGRQKKRS